MCLSNSPRRMQSNDTKITEEMHWKHGETRNRKRVPSFRRCVLPYTHDSVKRFQTELKEQLTGYPMTPKGSHLDTAAARKSRFSKEMPSGDLKTHNSRRKCSSKKMRLVSDNRLMSKNRTKKTASKTVNRPRSYRDFSEKFRGKIKISVSTRFLCDA